MQAELIALVLVAAFLHGVWGAAGRASRDPAMAAVVGMLLPALIAAGLARVVTAPASEAWPWMAASIGLHLGYILSLLLAWRFLALTVAYPIARAGAVPAAAAAGLLWLDLPLPATAMAGIGAIAMGLAVLGASRAVLTTRGFAGAAVALLAAVFLGGATAMDFVGLHRAQSTLGYIVWINLLEGAAILLLAVLARGRRVLALPWRELPLQILCGLCVGASYAMVLWALSLAPLAPVAALRETQALVAALFAAAFLNEKLDARRIAACVLVVSGLVAVSL